MSTIYKIKIQDDEYIVSARVTPPDRCKKVHEGLVSGLLRVDQCGTDDEVRVATVSDRVWWLNKAEIVADLKVRGCPANPRGKVVEEQRKELEELLLGQLREVHLTIMPVKFLEHAIHTMHLIPSGDLLLTPPRRLGGSTSHCIEVYAQACAELHYKMTYGSQP